MRCLVNIGDRFGRLTVISNVREPGSKRTTWICHCDCGKEKQIQNLRRNGKGTQSCGCLYRETHGRKLVDISGFVFGRLTVVRPTDEYKGVRRLWECVCSCGKTCRVIKTSLKQGHTQSCGCLFRDSARSRCGPNHARWKNDKTTKAEKHRIRNSQQYINWRLSVFLRDNYFCQVCSIRGGKLHCHHLDSFSSAPLKRFDVDNGVTLCENCHGEFHRRYGQGGNTKEQFMEFVIEKRYVQTNL